MTLRVSLSEQRQVEKNGPSPAVGAMRTDKMAGRPLSWAWLPWSPLLCPGVGITKYCFLRLFPPLTLALVQGNMENLSASDSMCFVCPENTAAP